MREAGPPACPCGQVHEFTPQIRVAYENITRGLTDTVTVVAGRRAWEVPRVYLAAHGLKADEVPGIARRYGFTEASA